MYVGKEAVIGDDIVLFAGVFIGDRVKIGNRTVVYPNVSILEDCVIGNDVIIHAGTVIGSDGFGFVQDGTTSVKIPQIGIVQIDDNVEIGANNCIDRAALGKTWIKKGVKTDNLVQVAHNVVIGEDTIVVSQAGIAGSVSIGRQVIIGGQVGISDHVDIGIITRDVFSIGVNLNPRNTDDISFSIFDRNLFGNGWEFRNNFRYRSNLEPPLDYEGIFSIRNIMGTFISGSFVYKNNYDVDQIWFNLSKAYLTQEIKYGGGIDLIQTIQDDVNHDYKITLFKSQVQDYWVGRSFILGDPDDRRNIRIGARYFKLLYDKRPFTSADSNVTYHNRELYLGNITLSQLKYLTSSLITGFGITEDVPVGYSLEITGGLSDEEFKNRSYFGLEVRMASYNGNFGYLGGIAQLGSYLQNKEWEDGVFGLNFIYFSPLFNL